MELASNLAIAAGILVEILLLWETADRQKAVSAKPGFLTSRLSRLQEILGLTLAGSWLLILLAEWINPPLSLKALNFIQNAILGPSFFFLFVFGMVVPRLLPRINEQTLVIINLLALYGLLTTVQLAWYAWVALLLPSLGVLILALTQHWLSPAVKSLFYGWYLVCLLLLAYQNNYELFFQPTAELRLTSMDYFIGGAAGIFLLLHSLFLVRFFLMLSANLLPYNRYLITQAMPQLFDDQQIPRWKFLALLGGFAGLVLVNQLTGFVPSLSLLNLLVLLAAHFMDRPFLVSEKL